MHIFKLWIVKNFGKVLSDRFKVIVPCSGDWTEVKKVSWRMLMNPVVEQTCDSTLIPVGDSSTVMSFMFQERQLKQLTF